MGHVSMVVDIPINCCVRLLYLVPNIALLTLRDGKHEIHEISNRHNRTRSNKHTRWKTQKSWKHKKDVTSRHNDCKHHTRSNKHTRYTQNASSHRSSTIASSQAALFSGYIEKVKRRVVNSDTRVGKRRKRRTQYTQINISNVFLKFP